jgi:L-lactate dehydrogenase complex protein LldG
VTAREEVLARIRSALGPDAGFASASGPGSAPGRAAGSGPAPAAGAAVDAGYRTHGDLAPAELLDLLAERVADYKAVVRRASPAGLGGAVGAALTERGARRVVVPAGLILPAWPAGVEAVEDDGLSATDLDGLDGVVTGAAVAIAETGTIVLDGSAGQGGRAITLVPDYHLCIVQARQVVQLVPEAIHRLGQRAGRPLTWISGPSATSDIELSRVEGVHGPRTLEVILVSGG